MQARVHGHDVLDMMVESGQVYTRERLRADIIAAFGEEARFYTCAADNLTADELITFLQARGKFVEASGGFRTEPEKICDH